MKKIVITLLPMFILCASAQAVSRADMKTVVSKIGEIIEKNQNIRNFAGIVISNWARLVCNDADFENKACTPDTFDQTKKDEMLARVKALDDEAYALETERHNLIQAQ